MEKLTYSVREKKVKIINGERYEGPYHWTEKEVKVPDYWGCYSSTPEGRAANKRVKGWVKTALKRAIAIKAKGLSYDKRVATLRAVFAKLLSNLERQKDSSNTGIHDGDTQSALFCWALKVEKALDIDECDACRVLDRWY
jgi:hypothetical protein